MLNSFTKKFTGFFLLLSLFTYTIKGQAQVLDAGSLQQNIEKELNKTIPPQTQLPKTHEVPIELELTGVTFTIYQVSFIGNTLLTDTQLNVLVAPYLGHPIDFNQLQLLSYSIETAYKQNGFYARVILPEQELQDGKLRIIIEEAVFGKTKIDGNITRIKPQQIIDIIGASQISGELLRTDGLDRGFLLGSDLSGISITGMMAKGSEPKSVDLVVKAEDKPLVFMNVITDNSGPIAIGKNRLIVDMGLQSPFKIGDLFSATYLKSSGSDYLHSIYSLPIGNNGFKVGIFASSLKYNLVSSEFKALNANGTSRATGIEASYPLIRSWDKNLYLNAKIYNRHFTNSSLGSRVSNYDSMDYTIGINGNFFDSIGGGGLNTIRTSLIMGNVDLSNSPNQKTVAATNNAQGDFTKLSYGFKREQFITSKLILSMSLQGQASNYNLDSSEKFYLGGPLGVRAYPVNEGGGSSGNLLSIELSQILPQNFVVATFFDYGRVEVNSNNNFVGSSEPNEYSLKGAGVSLAWHPTSNINLKASWATRIGSNPNYLINGADQDGTKVKNRFWFAANISF